MHPVPPLLCLIVLLGVLALLQAHHPGKAGRIDQALVVVAAAEGLVVLVLAVSQVVALTQP